MGPQKEYFWRNFPSFNMLEKIFTKMLGPFIGYGCCLTNFSEVSRGRVDKGADFGLSSDILRSRPLDCLSFCSYLIILIRLMMYWLVPLICLLIVRRGPRPMWMGKFEKKDCHLPKKTCLFTMNFEKALRTIINILV